MEGGAWTFVTNHGAILAIINDQPDATVPVIAAAANVSQRSAARIIADLRRAGYVTARRVGQRNQYRVATQRRLRHDAFSDVPVANLLSALLEGSRKRSRGRTRGSR